MRSFWMLAASLFFSLMAAFAKFGTDAFGAYELVFYRQLFATIVLYGFVVARGRTLRTPYIGSHFKRSILGTAALLIWFYAIAHLPLGTAMTLNYTNPLWMAAIAVVLALRRHDPLEWKLLLCVVLGFFGITLVLNPDVHSADFLPGLIGLSSGFLAALAQFQVRQMTELHEPEWRIVFYFSLTGTVASLVCHFLFEGPMTMLTLENGWPVLGMAVSGILAQLSMTRAWSGESILLTSSLQYAAIVFAAVFGWMFFDEPISLWAALGILIITVAGVGATLETRRKMRKSTGGEPHPAVPCGANPKKS